ncbi:polysaccharide biosynthesis/export family protein [Microbaculum marinum]|uniref:Polysaccharide biosynthesis/export family protein n=1 Tax=Microbaculum marinum TaxID=1764581 RepID=A0AAW9RKM1_9HYPH
MAVDQQLPQSSVKLPDNLSAQLKKENPGAGEYRIGPLDELEVSVFQVPDLSKTAQVSATGQISMPLIGAVEAGGKTVPELEAHIASKLSEKYLQSPQVTVFITEYNSQRVTVDGAVIKPGVYPLSGPTTLLQTVAVAGGLNSVADPQSILVFRTVGDQRSAAKFDLSAIRDGKAPDPTLQGGDVIVVDTSGIRTIWGGVKEVIPVVGVFTWLL